jgi:hypothetical protein
MRHERFAVLLTACAVLACARDARAQAVEPPPCPPQPGREVRAFGGEIAGSHDYREELGQGWTFVLAHDPWGWNARVLDESGTDLTQLTPPWRFAPNPRELHGWHFRNADNTAPNDGSVNAPQRHRLFTISPGVIGTGGFKPSAETASADAEADESDGRGSLTIVDYGLADLEAGAKARMVYLKFVACLSWPAAPASATAAAFTDEDVERLAGCGLSAPYVLDAFLTPPTQSGDFDGDGAHDLAATIRREADGKRGIAICRAGTWLDVIGLDETLGELTPVYFDRMDYWRVDPRTAVPVSAVGGVPPVLRGDGLTIGMDGKSSVLLYWDGSRFGSYWQGD